MSNDRIEDIRARERLGVVVQSDRAFLLAEVDRLTAELADLEQQRDMALADRDVARAQVAR